MLFIVESLDRFRSNRSRWAGRRLPPVTPARITLAVTVLFFATVTGNRCTAIHLVGDVGGVVDLRRRRLPPLPHGLAPHSTLARYRLPKLRSRMSSRSNSTSNPSNANLHLLHQHQRDFIYSSKLRIDGRRGASLEPVAWRTRRRWRGRRGMGYSVVSTVEELSERSPRRGESAWVGGGVACRGLAALWWRHCRPEVRFTC